MLLSQHQKNSFPLQALKPVIALRGINFHREGKEILRDIDLNVMPGDFIVITGPNGGGKTTLLRLILKLLKPSSGTVSYYSPEGFPVKKINIGYLPQKNMIDSHFPVTVNEVVNFGLLSRRVLDKKERKALCDESMRLCGVDSFADRAIGNLSGGQLQRSLLARAIVGRPDFLVLDEPLSYIDKIFEPRLYGIISNLHHQGTTVLLVSHEITHLAEMATRHLLVDRTLEVCHASVHYRPSTCD